MAMVTLEVADATEFLEACKRKRIPLFENGLSKMVGGQPVFMTFEESGKSEKEWAEDVLASHVSMTLMQHRCQTENDKVAAATAKAEEDGLDHAGVKAATEAAREAADAANVQHRKDVIAMSGKVAFK